MNAILRIDDETTAVVSIYLHHRARFSTGLGEWLHDFDNECRAPGIHVFDFLVEDYVIFGPKDENREAIQGAAREAITELRAVRDAPLNTAETGNATLIARYQVDEYSSQWFDTIYRDWGNIFDACSLSPHDGHGLVLQELIEVDGEAAGMFSDGSFFYIHEFTTHPAFHQGELMFTTLLVLLRRLARMGGGIVIADPECCARRVLGEDPTYGAGDLAHVLRALGFRVPDIPTDPGTAHYRLVGGEVVPGPQLVSGVDVGRVAGGWSIEG